MDFFAADTIRLYYVNVEMPPETPLPPRWRRSRRSSGSRADARDGEVRAILSYAGSMFTETEQRLGDHLGQILVGLNPQAPGLRSVEEMMESIRSRYSPYPAHCVSRFCA